MIAQSWQKLLFQDRLHLLTIRLCRCLPIHRIVMAQMRHRAEGIKGIPVRGRNAWISHTGSMDIKTHVIGQMPFDENVAHQSFVAWTVQDRVMPGIGPHSLGASCAKIPNEKAHRPSGTLYLCRCPPLA